MILPPSHTPTTQLSRHSGLAIPPWAGTVMPGFPHKTKASLVHFVPQGTPVHLFPVLVLITTVSLFSQPTASAIWLTASIRAGHALIHWIGGAAPALLLIHVRTRTAFIRVMILTPLTFLEFDGALNQAYTDTLLHKSPRSNKFCFKSVFFLPICS